jgi:hypothetical protein
MRKQLLKLVALLSALSLLVAFSAGCSTTKEAVAAPKPTAVTPTAPKCDQQKIDSLMKRIETASALVAAAAQKADLASQNAQIAVEKAEKATMRAEGAANKAEAIFKKKMKK